MSRGPLLIVGASGRAAAGAMRRAGWEPTVIDLFADADTRQFATTLRCDLKDYPLRFVELAKLIPPMPWMYTGGLENYPEVIGSISERHSLLGNPPDVIQAVRDPFQFSKVLRDLGLLMPELHSHVSFLERDRSWLRKPFRGSGGIGIVKTNVPRPDSYFQEFIPGEPISAAFDGLRLLGISRQLCGTPWLHAPPWRYAGNLRDDNSPHREAFERLGQQLVERFHLCGPWGLDAIDGERLAFLELNPRYTASMELYETDGPATKAIYYSTRTIEFPRNGPWLADGFADIPLPGTVIEPGQPVLTIFADNLLKLKATAAELDTLFGVTP